MTGGIIATHGNLATELLKTATFITGDLPNIRAMTMDLSEPVDVIKKAMQQAIKEVDKGNGVLILTDMFGGTPSNMAISFHENNRVEVITGVNLPMIIKLAQLSNEKKTLVEIASEVVQYSQKSITHATALLD